jgi:hypothetical protein
MKPITIRRRDSMICFEDATEYWEWLLSMLNESGERAQKDIDYHIDRMKHIEGLRKECKAQLECVDERNEYEYLKYFYRCNHAGQESDSVARDAILHIYRAEESQDLSEILFRYGLIKVEEKKPLNAVFLFEVVGENVVEPILSKRCYFWQDSKFLEVWSEYRIDEGAATPDRNDIISYIDHDRMISLLKRNKKLAWFKNIHRQIYLSCLFER